MSFASTGRIKVTPSYALEYHVRDIERGCYSPPTINKSYGYLSHDSIKKIRERVNYMVYIAREKTLRKAMKLPITKYKLVFVTLTLSAAQIHSDKIIKEKLLQPFLRILRNRYKVVNYLWKAEAQDNGNIHFHVTIDRYVHWSELRMIWNTLQESLGYITRAGVEDPNSTDIHAVYKCKNPAAYLCGYIGKKDLYKKELDHKQWQEHYYKDLLNITACDLKTKQEVGIKRPLEGKIYDCNNELKSINATWEMNMPMSREIESEHEEGSKRISSPFFTITFLNSLVTGEDRYLKYLLDRSIEYAYLKQDVNVNWLSFQQWLTGAEHGSKKATLQAH